MLPLLVQICSKIHINTESLMLWFCNNATCTTGNCIFAVFPKVCGGQLLGHTANNSFAVCTQKHMVNIGHMAKPNFAMCFLLTLVCHDCFAVCDTR